MTSASYLVVNDSLSAIGHIYDASLPAMTERHHFEMPVVNFKATSSVAAEGLKGDSDGVIVILNQGLPNREQYGLIRRWVGGGRRTLLFWPAENALEVIDQERLASLRRHRLALLFGYRLKAWLERRNRRRAGASSAAAGSASSVVATAGADATVVLETVALIGREAESLDIHLRGVATGLRQSVGGHADQIEGQIASMASQLEAAKAPSATEGLGADARPIALVLQSLEEMKSTVQGIRDAGTHVAGHIEDGLPLLERVRQQSTAAHQDIGRLATSTIIAGPPIMPGPHGADELPAVSAFLRNIAEDPRPVPFELAAPPNETTRLPGTGLYLRLDFWAPLTSGGSYGHTCYQAKALSKSTQDFVCVMANHYEMLDDLGVRQITVAASDTTGVEANILGMNRHYAERLGVCFDIMRPSFIFERCVLGNAVGAWASRRFGIPYFVEYNGSEISMKRSFAGAGYEHEDLLLLAEDAAFRQATLISVVSDHVAADVARRGIPEERILVNPNAVDLEAYRPAEAAERRLLRASLGLSESHCVVGFIGTFGGWHGIDVLAESLQPILASDPSIRFLLIGDGNLKGLVTDAIARNGLGDRVVDVGRVPQARGAQLLKACDILVSPHSSNMIDSPFFGSPTKLFEYMAMGVGIVASDLEQIAHVLSPGIRPAELATGAVAVTDQRAVLCQPGNVSEFVDGVLVLVRDRAAAAALGRNARLAAESHYTWDQHARNLWLRLAKLPQEGYAIDRLK